MWIPRDISREGALYRALAQAIEDDVGAGRLRAGDRLPTQRKLARELGVSVGTVTRAYGEAESRGVIYGEVGRGTFVGRRSGVARFGERASADGPVDLALTWPLHCLDPDLAPGLRAIAADPEVGRLLEYAPNAGHAHHRAAGARWAEEQGIAVGPDRVVVCAGAQHAITVALATLAEPGDTLLCEAMTYPGLKAIAAALHLRLAGVAMDDEGIRVDAFEAACRSRRPKALYTVPTIQNPTTGVLGEERRREIVRVAERYGVAIVEDEVHRLLHSAPPPAFATLAPALTYTVLSLSKVVAGGLRIAFLVVPEAAVERVSRMVWATAWMAPPLLGELATRWIGDGTARVTAERKRKEARARQGVARDELGAHAFRTTPGAYHLWMPLPSRWTSSAFGLACQGRGVAVAPSDTFAVGREPRKGAVRIALSGTRTREELSLGLRRLVDVIESRGPVSPVI